MFLLAIKFTPRDNGTTKHTNANSQLQSRYTLDKYKMM